ncbi:MAG: hypothetical protein KIT22_05485 [Verrucomicrobiae bacterium]|nr:hypothetical protein [Verrucomicrobiae bacterium]
MTDDRSYIDGSVYPDCEPPEFFRNDHDRADYLDRVCTALDFGVVPEPETLEILSHWKDIFDRFPVSQSSGYHALRDLYGWEPVRRTPYFKEPFYRILDAREDRSDPCESMI